MRTWILILGLLQISVAAMAQQPAYKLFTGKGKQVGYTTMVKKMEKADVVLFGEEHNNAIAHWLQRELLQDLYRAKNDKLIVGAEMLEADNQLIINEYLKGLIPEGKLQEARMWPNFDTDYKPLLEFAKAHNLPFIATNIPRRYASAVYRKGGFKALKQLSEEAKKYIAPLPVKYNPDLSVYKQMREGMPMGARAHGGNNIENLPKAQAIKDATMAYFIHKHYKKGHLFLHFNGRLHSDFNEGIPWYLNEYAPKMKVLTISTRKQDNMNQLEEAAKGIADLVLVVPQAMTDTY